jgi:hypothetical protein
MGFVRLAVRTRLPWPTHVWALLLLVAISALLFYKVMIEDYGPFDGAINYHRVTVMDRSALGYARLPKFRVVPGYAGGGYFDSYATIIQGQGSLGYCQYDIAYWPGGDPGLGLRNPLPPMVQRHEIYAIDPEVPLIVLGVGWVGWALLFVRYVLRRRARAAGFEVLPAAPSDI